MTVISYAQNFEDVMLWRALKDVKKGFYIDVGAHSPDEMTVTRLFYEHGWHGINLEPSPPFFAELERRRPHDLNLAVAVSDESGEVAFHKIEESGLSTLDADIAKRATDIGWTDDILRVPMLTLAEICAEHVPEGQPIHFLKIDVEGLEEKVIRGADWTRWRPWIVVAEATIPMSPEQNYSGWDPLILDAGYDFVWFDGLNRYYVAREHGALKDAFQAPPNVYDQFRLADDISHERRALEAEARLADEAARLAETETVLHERLAETEGTLQASLAKAAATMRAELCSEGRAGVEAIGARIDILQRETSAQLSDLQRTQQWAVKHLQRRLEEELLPFRGMLETLEWSRKPLWIRLFFRRSGKPKKALRRLLFHASGKPRGMFRSLVVHSDGRPHSPFRKWMESSDYLNLRSAVRSPSTAARSDPAQQGHEQGKNLSAGADLARRRILARRAPGSKGN
ncbi:FkbM family methyltransferase [Acidimangrovimonas sediminis]|uniref:FkbM family methyltransferase n=1 Tax=Acidimangrovimonas sediminis TaxID=2056283 RepID=UPI000C80AFA9|nr:FkbM family methyltransferase [Acidimangrovimonas sediminis]